MKGRGTLVLAALGALCVVAVLAGCGDGSNAAATEESSAPLSKAQFVNQAEDICLEEAEKKEAAVAASFQELEAKGRKSLSPQDTSAVVEESVLPAYRNVVKRLAKLGAPHDDKAEVEKMIDEYESALQALEAEPGAATKHNPFAKPDESAKAYGIEDCNL